MVNKTVRTSIRISKLYLDQENPRLREPQSNQRDTLLEIAEQQSDKLIRLAEHISRHGPNPTDLLAVMPAAKEEDRYVVLDGNRRLAAVKLLDTPESAKDVLSGRQMSKLKKCSERYQSHALDSFPCIVLANRQQADIWISLTHRGENEGAGLVRWSGQVAARYDARQGRGRPYAHQLMRFVEENADLSDKAQDRINQGEFPITNLDRLIGTPYVREKLGIDKDTEEECVVTYYPVEEIMPGLQKIVEDLATGRVNVSDIRRQTQRIEFVDSMQSVISLDDQDKFDEPQKLEQAPDIAPRKKERPEGPQERPRKTLIPANCPLAFNHQRLDAIYGELTVLRIERFQNCASVMLRVMLELSVDRFLQQVNWGNEKQRQRSKLQVKVSAAAKQLKREDRLSQEQEDTVNRAISSQYLCSSINTMHAYVHSCEFTPSPADLRASWDNLQPFFQALSASLTD